MPAVAGFAVFTKTHQKPQKQAFQVNPFYQPILRERKREIEQRLHSSKALTDLGDPELSASNIHYEISRKATGLSCGGVGVVHQMVNKLGLAQAIDERLRLLAIHKPYYESDHVLSVAYNILAGGNRLEDLELRRQDVGYMNSLGARRLPDPTTVGDFTRRFSQDDVLTLQEAINVARQRVWQHRRSVESGFLEKALIDVDGTICGTFGECKQGMSMSYKGVWGYHVLLVTLANTREVLYCVNRPGNVASNEGNAAWLDRAIELVRPHSAEIILRGDTDFSNCPHLDRWHEQAVNFIFGMDAHAKVVAAASTEEKVALAKKHGADAGFVYPSGPLSKDQQKALSEDIKRLTDGKGADVLYDPVGGDYAEPALRAMNWEGRYLVIGFAAGDIPRVPLNLTLLKGCDIVGVFWGASMARDPKKGLDSLKQITNWIAEGKLKPHVSAKIPLARAGEAIRMLMDRKAQGKVVVVT